MIMMSGYVVIEQSRTRRHEAESDDANSTNAHVAAAATQTSNMDRSLR